MFLCCNVLNDLGGEKKHAQRVLSRNLVEISKEFLIFIDIKITETRFTTIQSSFVRMPIYRARTRQFFAFSPFSRPESPMTIKSRVFVAIMEGKLELGLRLGLS